jgi:D-alanyl-D-alanine carboxypeptidase/D-alanyl-D-alanine-endopeptidase (penicillin-binding protein 4)
LSANYAAFFVRVAPGAAEGDPLRVEVDPPLGYLAIENRGRTGGPKAARTLRVGRGKARSDGETVAVSGQLRVGDPAREFPRSVADPVLYAGALFKFQLEALGIEVRGRVRRGVAPPGVELLRYSGRPLAEIVRLFLKYSNNSMAESLVKTMGATATGAQGSWSTGLGEVRRRLAVLGVLGPGAVIADGSGLAPENRLSPRMLVQALAAAAQSFRFGPEFVAALPIGGRDGTLENRTGAVPDRVRAKTGLLGAERVVALSGFAQRADGETVTFSILVNGYAGEVEQAMEAVDAWVAALVRAD